MRRDDAFITTNFGRFRADICHRVLAILEDVLGVPRENLLPDADIADDLRGHDMAMAEIIMALEEEFALEIPDEEAVKLNKVSDLVALVDGEASESLAG